MKKILYVTIALLIFAFSFAACMRLENEESSSGGNSSASNTSSSVSSQTDKEDPSSAVSENTSKEENTEKDGFLLDDFSKAYRDAGFDVTEADYRDGLKSIQVKLKDAADDIYYEIVSFANAAEAKAEMDKINEAGEKQAYVNGNALVIGEKDYENHDKYMEPFDSMK